MYGCCVALCKKCIYWLHRHRYVCDVVAYCPGRPSIPKLFYLAQPIAVLWQDGVSSLSSGPPTHGADVHTRLTYRHCLFCLCLGCASWHCLRSSSWAAQHAVVGLQAPLSPPCQLELGDCSGAVRAARRLKGSAESMMLFAALS